MNHLSGLIRTARSFVVGILAGIATGLVAKAVGLDILFVFVAPLVALFGGIACLLIIGATCRSPKFPRIFDVCLAVLVFCVTLFMMAFEMHVNY